MNSELETEELCWALTCVGRKCDVGKKQVNAWQVPVTQKHSALNGGFSKIIYFNGETHVQCSYPIMGYIHISSMIGSKVCNRELILELGVYYS